ncbi:hexose kinase [Plantibacter sp. ME-Dv--P-095]|uniref:1-phosphofructokinase family hexose kinase n=1 Tax=Plantibacter sp. ME-Dv--P-095 TaxID=3040299 RepID=UPI00254B3406|nr:hexose kinase [Plantibacter sp. ME-Dv--P-095]
MTTPSLDGGQVVIVTPNPAVDITYEVAEQQIGVTQRVGSVVRRAGGKGVNVARVLAMLGIPTVQVLPLGGSSGSWLRTALESDGLATRVVSLADETRSTVAVVDGHHHPTLFAEAGPAVTPEEWAAVTTELTIAVQGASMLVLSGSLPPNTPDTVVASIVRVGVDAGVPVVVDVSGPALLAAARAGATILKPNLEEALEATGTSTLTAARAALLALGAGTVVISRGADGLTAGDAAGEYEVPAVPGVRGNPTGAGDAATAGLVAALLAGDALPEALRTAAAAGAAAVLEPVAGSIDLDAFRSFLAPPIRSTTGPSAVPTPSSTTPSESAADHSGVTP